MVEQIMRILLVDDMEDARAKVRKALVRNLVGIRHEIVEADDGKPGVEIFAQAAEKREPFRLVVTDYLMVYDGDYMAADIRKLDPEVQIIAVSSRTGEFEIGLFTKAANAPLFNKNEHSWHDKGPLKFQEIISEVIRKKQEAAGGASSQSSNDRAKRMPPPPMQKREHRVPPRQIRNLI